MIVAAFQSPISRVSTSGTRLKKQCSSQLVVPCDSIWIIFALRRLRMVYGRPQEARYDYDRTLGLALPV